MELQVSANHHFLKIIDTTRKNVTEAKGGP
jgi:hypothetical protein